MKSKLVAVLITLIAAIPALSQNIRLNGYGSYVFDDKVDSYYDASNYYNGTIKGGFQWGAGIELLARPHQGIELLYQRHEAKAPMTYYKGSVKFTNFDLSSNFIMLASNRYFRRGNSKLEGFAGGMLGADIMSLKNPDNGNSSSTTKFAWGIRGGVNIWATENFGIKLQAQLLSAVQSVGGGFYFGSGGVGTGISGYSSMYQFGLGGGLVFNIPAQKKK